MQKTVYLLMSADKKYIAVQQSPHAAILPLEQAEDKKKNLLVFATTGKASQAKSKRFIRDCITWEGRELITLCSQKDLIVVPAKLTLDI